LQLKEGKFVSITISFHFSIGQCTTIFKAEVYATKACMAENLDRNYRSRNACILSDSQAIIKALSNPRITSKLVWHCHQSLMQLIRVLGHEGNDGKKQ
jgi:hypothetical protein